MASKTTLRYVILYVDDVDRAVAFYSKVFGFKPGMRQGPYAELATGKVTLALSERGFVTKELGLKPGPKGAGSSEIGMVVSEEEVPLVYQAALDAKATSVVAPKKQPWGQLVSYVRDLDGHLIEICSPND
jgi:lactoylglutathione lyase